LDFMKKSMAALLEIRSDWDILWSPAWIDKYTSYDAQGLIDLEEGI